MPEQDEKDDKQESPDQQEYEPGHGHMCFSFKAVRR
jgi:hypothetical protein